MTSYSTTSHNPLTALHGNLLHLSISVIQLKARSRFHFVESSWRVHHVQKTTGSGQTKVSGSEVKKGRVNLSRFIAVPCRVYHWKCALEARARLGYPLRVSLSLHSEIFVSIALYLTLI